MEGPAAPAYTMGGRTYEAHQGHETPGPSDYIPETHDSFGRGGLAFTIKGREGMGCACVFPPPPPLRPLQPRPAGTGLSLRAHPARSWGRRPPPPLPTPPPPSPGAAHGRAGAGARDPARARPSPRGQQGPAQSEPVVPSARGTDAGDSFSEQTQEPARHARSWAVHAQVWQPLPAGAESPGGDDGDALQEHARPRER